MDGEREQQFRTAALVVLVSAVWLIAVISLGWCYRLHLRLDRAERELTEMNKSSREQRDLMADADARLRAATATLAQGVGITQRQLELKARELSAQQEHQKEEGERLARAQVAAKQQLGQVTNAVSDVKSDIGDVKTDVAATRSEVELTKAELTRTVGDAGVMSGLIARNHEEFEALKRAGGRHYFEFTLRRGAPAQQVSNVQLKLTRTDDKHARYTMVVVAEDHNIEKRDKSLLEPVQFYAGVERALYEVVVNSISKDKVSGYLSAPM